MFQFLKCPKVALAALGVASCLNSGSMRAQAQSMPNVVVFYADDVGQGDIKAYGFGSRSLVPTPNIDALARQGVRFTNCHSAASVCAPSRYALLTGNLPLRGRKFTGIGLGALDSQILPGQRTTGDVFKSAGYATGFFGKVHLGGGFSDSSGRAKSFRGRRPNLSSIDFSKGIANGVDKHGFTTSFLSTGGIQEPPYVYFQNNKLVGSTTFSNNRWRWSVVNRKTAANTPFRLLQSNRPGSPGYLPLDRDGNGVAGKVTKYAGNKNDVWALGYWDSTKTGEIYTQAALNFIDANSNRKFYMHFASQAVHAPNTPDTFFGTKVRKTQKTRHLDMLVEMDLQVKAIVDKLKQKGIYDDTLFIFTSDNGGLSPGSNGHYSSGRLRGVKRSIHEGGHRVPCIARWPKGNIPANKSVARFVSQTDFFATFAALVRKPQPASQGRDSNNIWPYFLGNTSRNLHRYGVTTHRATREITSGSAKGRFVDDPKANFRLATMQTENWKIIAKLRKSAPYTPFEVTELYNLNTDRAESRNLVNSPGQRERRDAMFAQLRREIAGN